MTNEEKLSEKYQILSMFECFSDFSPLSKEQFNNSRRKMLSDIEELKNKIRKEKLRKIDGN
jgi:hypothetical protein